MFAIRSRPSLVLVSVEAVHCNNTRINSQSSVVHFNGTNLLDDRILSFCHDFKTLRACLKRLLHHRRVAGLHMFQPNDSRNRE